MNLEIWFLNKEGKIIYFTILGEVNYLVLEFRNEIFERPVTFLREQLESYFHLLMMMRLNV